MPKCHLSHQHFEMDEQHSSSNDDDNDDIEIKQMLECLSQTVERYLALYPREIFWQKQAVNAVTAIIHYATSEYVSDEEKCSHVSYSTDPSTTEYDRLEETLNKAVNRHVYTLTEMGFSKWASISNIDAIVLQNINQIRIEREAKKIVIKYAEPDHKSEKNLKICFYVLISSIMGMMAKLESKSVIDNNVIDLSAIELDDLEYAYYDVIHSYIDVVIDIDIDEVKGRATSKTNVFVALKKELETMVGMIKQGNNAASQGSIDRSGQEKRARDTCESIFSPAGDTYSSTFFQSSAPSNQEIVKPIGKFGPVLRPRG